jgi:hypothetical protein
MESFQGDGWLDEPIEITKNSDVRKIEQIRRAVFGGTETRPLQHLGEAQTCYVIKNWPEFARSWWITDDREALRYARFQGITTRETLDLMAMAEAWDIGRIGKNIRDNIDIAIMRSRVMRTGDFLLNPDAPVTVRTPTDLCQRTISQVHESELDLALVKVVSHAAGIGQDELTTRTARIYGWERRGSDITSRLGERISSLLVRGLLAGTPDNLTIARHPTDQ